MRLFAAPFLLFGYNELLICCGADSCQLNAFEGGACASLKLGTWGMQRGVLCAGSFLWIADSKIKLISHKRGWQEERKSGSLKMPNEGGCQWKV
jgi:hypothetical protein